MTILNPDIKNEHVIPSVESDIFERNPSAAFAIGILAVNDQARPGLEDVYRGYYDLRVKTYVDQTGQLLREELDIDGTDRDEDDSRSVAFGFVENTREKGIQRVIGAFRLIVKGQKSIEVPTSPVKDKELPVEYDFPGSFIGNPIQPGAFEVSRLISRHEDARTQQLTKISLYMSALAYSEKHELGPAYAIVEPWFARDLNRTMPMETIGEPEYVEKYLADNLPVKIDLKKYAQQVELRKPGLLGYLRDNIDDVTYYDRAGRVTPVAE